MKRWYDDFLLPELGDVPDLSAEELHRIALRQTYSLPVALSLCDDEARTQRLLDEDMARHRDRLHIRPYCRRCNRTYFAFDPDETLCEWCHADRDQLTEPLTDAQQCDAWLDSHSARDYLADTEE